MAVFVLSFVLSGLVFSSDCSDFLQELKSPLLEGLHSRNSQIISDVFARFSSIPASILLEQTVQCPQAIYPFIIIKAKTSADSLISSLGSQVDHTGAHHTWNVIANTAMTRLSSTPPEIFEEWGASLALDISENSLASLDNMVVHAFLNEPLIALRRVSSTTALPSDIFAKMNITSHPSYLELGCRLGSVCFSTPFRSKFGWRGVTVDPLFENPYVNIHRESITADNVDQIIEKHRVPPSIDLLVIDHDDASTLWRAMQRTRASVVAIRSSHADILESLRTYAKQRRYSEIPMAQAPFSDFLLFADNSLL